MANTLGNPTMGFQSFGRTEGGSPTAGLTPVWIASSDASLIFRGDPVFPSSSPGANASGRYITSVQVSSVIVLAGVFQGCEQFNPTVGRVVWSNNFGGSVTGSTGDIKAWIIDDPDTLFLIQGSTGATITSSLIGLNISFTNNSSTGNITSGYSNVAGLSSTVTALSSLPFRIVDYYSAYAPPAVPAIGANAFVNGTDNTSPANAIIAHRIGNQSPWRV